MGTMEEPGRVRIDIPSLRILRYPDPRLRQVCAPVERADDTIRALAARMFELMFAARGVGLAAIQVGLPIRLFVASPTFQDADRRVYIDPAILAVDGQQDGEEGCLSFPGIYARLPRHNVVTIRARNPQGEWFEEKGEGLAARIFEHEVDHLDARLLVDRMGSLARLSHRRALRDLEEQYAETGV